VSVDPASDSQSSADALDERLLVELLRAGDEDAFTTLLDRYGASLLRLALLYVKDRATAEDVVGETWLGVVRGIDRFEGRSSLKTWLFTILTNRAKSRGLRESRSTPLSALAASDPDDELEIDRFFPAGHAEAGGWTSIPKDWHVLPEQELTSAETIEAVRAAIATLPPNQRDVITLRDVDGWSSEEVRNVLMLSESNQRVLLHRARAKVRRALEEQLEL
jgi:RNA polymerase sigma-70 factor (ECF subfamily)